jgi:unsaturated rhamnogalacturonyl hydrolase
MHIIKSISLVLMALFSLHAAAAWNDNEVSQIEQRIQLPKIKAQQFVITSFGAKTSATAKENQAAINRAIATASRKGGGEVIVPKGTWNTGAIRLQSHVNLVVSEGATLKFAFEPKLYPLVKTSWEGMGCWNYSPCIYAYRATDVALSGKGTVDGNGSNETWWKWNGAPRFGYQEGVTKESQRLGSRAKLQKYAEDGVPEDQRKFGMGYGLRPQLVNFVECERVLVKDVNLINSPFWVIHPLRSKSITVDGVKVYNDGPNGDGCDPEACSDVIIKNCVFHTGDDCIAIKSGRNNDGRLWNQPSENIIIRNCKMEDGHGGVVIGSEISGGCRNVYAEDCEMDSPNLDRVLRIKTNNCRGGVIENINVRNIRVGQCGEAVLKINLDYESNEDCYRGYQPIVRNVTMENVTCKKSEYGVLMIGLNDSDNIYNIHVNNCHWDGVEKDPVKITGKTHDIFFNNLFINGSLVLNDADKPFKNLSQWMTWSEMKRNPQSWLLDFSKKPKWSYVMGIELEGMLDTYLRYKNDSVLKYVESYPEKMISDKGVVTGYNYNDFNLDNIRTAKFICRMQQIAPRKGNELAMKTFFKQLQHQPRTEDGVFWHKAIYAHQVWLDGIFMGLPFYCQYASQYLKPKKAEKVYDDAVNQIITTDKRTYDQKTGLWKHAWDETHSQFWANKTTGQSQHTWARALGWYVMAMTEVLDVLPENYARRGEVEQLLQKAMTAVVKYQDKKSNVWYDVMDVKDSTNYLEATASSMFAYVLLKGVRKGYLPETLKVDSETINFKEAGQKAYAGILKNFIRVNADKTISLTRCCSVSGLGPGPGPNVKKPNYKRDGSFAYYMSEPIRDNDAKGIGPFIWASLEMEK